MKQIIVVKPGTITEDNKNFLREEGVIVIEHDNPHEIRVITPLDGFEPDMMLDSLVHTVKNTASASVKQSFADIILSKMQQKNMKQ